MTTYIDLDLGNGLHLRPYQGDFLESFLNRGDRLTILSSPEGLGKSFVTAVATSAWVLRRPGARALVLVPASLTAMWLHRLHLVGKEATILDARSIRLAHELHQADPESWPTGVTVISVDLAKRPEHRGLLSSVSWGLLVLDEAQRLAGQRRKLVTALANASPNARILAVGTAMDLDASLGIARVVDWSEALGAHQFPWGPGKRTVVTYTRSVAELALLKALRSVRDIPLRPLASLAASSAGSVERALLRQVSSRDGFASGVEQARYLLDLLDAVTTDERTEAFRGVLRSFDGASERMVVFTSNVDTNRYVCSILTDEGYPVGAIHGGLSATERAVAAQHFHESGWVLVANEDACGGLSLSAATVVIHYDVPSSIKRYEQRRQRYARFGRSSVYNEVFFRDSSGTIPAEERFFASLESTHEQSRAGGALHDAHEDPE